MNNYSDLKREVAYTLRKVLLGTTRKQVRKTIEIRMNQEGISNLMRELDKTFKEHGLDWKLA